MSDHGPQAPLVVTFHSLLTSCRLSEALVAGSRPYIAAHRRIHFLNGHSPLRSAQAFFPAPPSPKNGEPGPRGEPQQEKRCSKYYERVIQFDLHSRCNLSEEGIADACVS